jgi:hypothetical protein
MPIIEDQSPDLLNQLDAEPYFKRCGVSTPMMDRLRHRIWPCRAAEAAVVVILLVLIAMAFLAPFPGIILKFVPDDGFYYLEIARRLGEGQGSTFDGINKTNGYHPLWLIALVPFSSLMEADRLVGARIAMTLGAVLFIASFFFIRDAARQIAPAWAWLALLFSAASLAFGSMYGMESALTAFLLALLLRSTSRSNLPERFATGAILGVIGGLLVLARLDAAPYVLMLDLYWFIRLVRTRDKVFQAASWQAFFASGIAQAAIVLPYLASNALFFGHVLTVSAMVKAGRTTSMNLLWARSHTAQFAILGTLLGWVAVATNRASRSNFAHVTAVGGTSVLMLLIVVQGGYETFYWYFVLPLLCAGLFLSTAVAGLRELFPAFPFRSAGLCACLIVGGMNIRSKLSEAPDSVNVVALFDRAMWIAQYAPQHTIFAESDCGLLAYVSRRPFINTDGLTNSFEFQRAIAADRLPEWLEQKGVNAMVTPDQIGAYPQPSATESFDTLSRHGQECMAKCQMWRLSSSLGTYPAPIHRTNSGT